MSHSRPGKWCRVSKNLQLRGKKYFPAQIGFPLGYKFWEIDSKNDKRLIPNIFDFLSVIYLGKRRSVRIMNVLVTSVLVLCP